MRGRERERRGGEKKGGGELGENGDTKNIFFDKMS